MTRKNMSANIFFKNLVGVQTYQILSQPHLRQCHQPVSVSRDTREQLWTFGYMFYRRLTGW